MGVFYKVLIPVDIFRCPSSTETPYIQGLQYFQKRKLSAAIDTRRNMRHTLQFILQLIMDDLTILYPQNCVFRTYNFGIV